jgi:hypothetical protein
MSTRCALKRTGLISAVAAMATVPAVQSYASQPHIAPIQSHPHGQTYSEWAADWWEFVLETPATGHPVLDETGAACDQGDMGNVWFLFGSFGSAPIERSCEIPVGTALFLPLINNFFGAEPDDPPEERTEEFVRERANCFEDSPTLTFELDGTSVPGLERFFEESEIFTVELPEDNIAGLPEGTELSPSVDAGFYLFLRPLPPGSYDLHWEASSADCGIAQDVTYHLTIRPGRRG